MNDERYLMIRDGLVVDTFTERTTAEEQAEEVFSLHAYNICLEVAEVIWTARRAFPNEVQDGLLTEFPPLHVRSLVENRT